MNRRKLAVTGVLVAALAVVLVIVVSKAPDDRGGTGHAVGSGTTGSQPPNILILIADDVGVDKVNSYADDAYSDYRAQAPNLPQTPVIDGLASVGARFTDAWANPTCSPTRAALFTGNYGFRTGVGKPLGRSDALPLELDATTLPEALAAKGYTTALFGKWHLGENDPPAEFDDGTSWDDHIGESFDYQLNPISQGFDVFRGTLGGELDEGGSDYGYMDWISLEATHCEDCEQVDTVEVVHQTDYATARTVDDALAWIETQPRPWMAALAFHGIHTPLEATYEGCNYRAEGAEAPTDEVGLHKEMMECLDIEIGALLDGITDLDDTLVIFVGDNGTIPSVGEGEFNDGRGKTTLYETGVRVPFIVADGRAVVAAREDFVVTNDWRRSPEYVADPGVEVADFVHVVDIFATLADVSGADASSAKDSISMIPLLSETDGAVRDVLYSETFSTDGTGDLGLRIGYWKLHTNVRSTTQGLCRYGYELYNLRTDRFETRDLSDREPDTVEEMKQALTNLAATQESAWFNVDDC